LLYFAAILVGPYYLAPMLSGDGSSTRHDINGARFLISSPGILAVLIFPLLIVRSNRKSGPAPESRISIAPLDEPNKTSKIESQ